jgi:hypothetical protein
MFVKTFSFCLDRHVFLQKIPDPIKEGAGTAGIASSWSSQQLQPPFKGRFLYFSDLSIGKLTNID